MILYEKKSYIRAGYSEIFQLDSEIIDKRVEEERIGTYILGVYKRGEPEVQYIGRSDTDLNARLKQHFWAEDESYRWFVFRHLDTESQAFEEECFLYHDFGGSKKLDNDIHPRIPDGKSYSCPVKGCDN